MPTSPETPGWVETVSTRPPLTPDGLRAIRARLGLSVPQLARALSDAGRRVPRSTVYAWEAGTNPIPPHLMLALLELARRRRARG